MWNHKCGIRFLSTFDSSNNGRALDEDSTSFDVATAHGSGDCDDVETIRNLSTLRSCSFEPIEKRSHRRHSSTHANQEENDDRTLNKSCKISLANCPCKEEKSFECIRNNSTEFTRRHGIIKTLQEMGIQVFIIDAMSAGSMAEIVRQLRRVVSIVARENAFEFGSGSLGFPRCVLYQDERGLLFNLMLPSHSVGPVKKFQEYMETFSGLEAMVAATILCRSLPCMTECKPLSRILKPMSS